MNSLVEIYLDILAYHTDRSLSCTIFTIGEFTPNGLWQSENTEYALAIL